MGVDNGKNMHGNHRARMREKLISSSEDVLLTRDLAFTMNKLGIELIDHILVANNKYTSIMCYG